MGDPERDERPVCRGDGARHRLGAGAALVGPVIGYELSDHSARPAHDEVTWIPTLNIDPHGARAGVAGSF